MFGNFFFWLIWSAMWGLIIKNLMKKKGYPGNWFIVGFILHVFALILVFLKPDRNKDQEDPAVYAPERNIYKGNAAQSSSVTSQKPAVPAYKPKPDVHSLPIETVRTGYGHDLYDKNITDTKRLEAYRDLYKAGIMSHSEYIKKQEEIIKGNDRI